MNGVRTRVSTVFDGLGKAYIYLWVSKKEKVVYVGQTNDQLGTLGRSYDHLKTDGTFRCKCLDRMGVHIDDMEDLTLVSYLLPREPEYIGAETSFRLAVEYLVQTKLIEKRSSITPIFRIVSNVTSTQRTNNSVVKELSEQIVDDFLTFYATFT